MASKKLLTYEGLEEYNIKWHERLQSLVIDADDVEEIFVDAMMENYTWSYEFDTTYGFPKNGNTYQHPWYYSSFDYPYLLGVVPFTLYGSENSSMTIDWGDGTLETVTSSMYQDPVVFRSSVHEYTTPGKYTISVTSSDWDQIYMVGGCASIGTYMLDVGYIGVYDSLVIDTKHEYPDECGHPYLKQVGYQDSDIYYSAQNIMSLMRCGCTKIFNPLPKIAGTIVSELYEYDWNNGNYSLHPVETPPKQEFAGLPLYGQYLDNQLYFILDDSHILGNNYPEDLFIYNKNSEILGAFGELDEVNGVKTPHVYVDIPETWTESANGILDLSLGNAFAYWPEGAGTKTISIANGTTAGFSKFFLKLTDAGNFFVEWGNNIQWEDGNEPEWQAFHEDIIMFKSDNNGNTWTAQIVQTNEIDPYWKITIKTETANQEFPIPFDQEYIGSVDWGDGSTDISTTINGYANDDSVYFLSHTYTNTGTYKIIMTMPNSGGYLVTEDGDPWYFDSKYMPYVISIDSPLPNLLGTYQWPSSYADKEDGVLYGCFAYYGKLLSIPEKLFWNNPNTDISGCFSSCSSLISIPSGLFDKHASITSFYQYFYNCTSLQSIPPGLFDKNTAVTSFDSCFQNCTSLQSIPSGLFDNNIAVTDFSYCFNGCSSLQSIPSGLFDSNTAVTTFYYCFYGCISLQSIPSGLFDKNTAVTRFNFCFDSCISLQSIPSGLFDKNTRVTSFWYCFANCSSIQSIPAGLFDNNTAVTTFYGCFNDCSSLQSIPSGLFDSNTAVTNFTYCFSGCTSLQSIPSGLFDSNTAVTTFYQCFYNCTSLQSIPSGLFDKNTAVTNFYRCFSGCSSLQSIPSGLFDKNTAVTNFQSCFSGCSSLQSIPSGLFDKNTAVTYFGGCFYGCTSLQSIPSGLFDKNTAVTNFSYCFSGCSSLTDFTLYIGSSSVSDCSSFVTSKANTTRTIYIPANSTTKTTFDAQASSLGLTILTYTPA